MAFSKADDSGRPRRIEPRESPRDTKGLIAHLTGHDLAAFKPAAGWR